MKKILITGADSYIGTSFEKWIYTQYSEEYGIDTLDMRSDSWKETDFGGYDCILHVAGVAHKKEKKEMEHIYYQVNRDLTIEVAQKAKREGVRQFVFLSSMSVYGMDTGIITKETPVAPKTFYGCSKWEAEQGLSALADESFAVCILRPPMVYGKGCRGNFNGIRRLVEKLPFFPCVKNRRSMIYVENLSAFIKLSIDRRLSGVYFPQNRDYVATIDMAKGIADAMNKTIRFDYLTGFGVRVLRRFYPAAKKGFGTLIYRDTEDFDFAYIVVENEPSFRLSIL